MDELVSYLNVEDGETTPDGKYTLESVSCLGCCSLAPAMMIGEETFGKLNGETAVKHVKNFEQ
jgi:NADH-quinone oxidoreductase subunit E